MSIWSNSGDKMHPIFYRVIITMIAPWDAVVANTSSGGITPNSEQALVAAGGAKGTSQDVSDSRARGNLRWDKVVQSLSEYTQASIFNINVTETNTVDRATSVGFSVSYEQDEYNRVEDLDTPGTFLTGKAFITQQLAVILSSVNIERRDVPVFGSNQRSQRVITASAPDTRTNIEADIAVESIADAASGIFETAQ